jgi:hypothetical protein
MLYREIIAVCCEVHTRHINTLCGQNVEFSYKECGTYSCHPCVQSEMKQEVACPRVCWRVNPACAYATYVLLKRVVSITWGPRWRSWLRHCSRNREVTGSISVTGFFH